jgi:biotin synthase
MCGIGPFIPHRATEFSHFPAGSVELTLYLLSIVRLAVPTVLLPATTALGTAVRGGREMGILAGANVVMPNLSPPDLRAKYELYNGKLHSGSESAEALAELEHQISEIGYKIVYERGDAKK